MCLNTPTYNSFSNKVSASDCLETSLEQPHDDIHLALGGFEGQIHGTSGLNDTYNQCFVFYEIES